MNAVICAAAGGIAGGTYTVFIKTESAAKVNPHPLAWTIYKCSWLFVFGVVLVLNRVIQQIEPVYVFSWWGIVCAVFWVPASLFMNAAVPRCGVAMASTLESGTVSVLTFVLGITVLKNKMELVSVGDFSVAPAPFIMVLIVAGIVMLAKAPHLCLPAETVAVLAGTQGAAIEAVKSSANSSSQLGGSRPGSRSINSGMISAGVVEPLQMTAEDPALASNGIVQSSYGSARSGQNPYGEFYGSSVSNPHMPPASHQLVGVAFAILSGCSAALQVSMVKIGKMVEQRRWGCYPDKSLCPPGGTAALEQFNVLGSWLLSFGIGGVLITFLAWVTLSASRRRHGEPPISIYFKEMGVAGSSMGFVWCVQTLLVSEALILGSAAVEAPAAKAVQIITAGIWGILYYKENSGWRALVWVGAAVWTISFMTLLGLAIE